MQDYHIYTHYLEEQSVSKTSPKHQRIESKTKAASKNQKEKTVKFTAPKKAIASGLVVATKINSYVGEITENTISASRRQVALNYAGMALLAATNPVLGLMAIGAYTADKLVKYNIKKYKQDLSADFMKQLSGGTVSTRG